MKRIFEIIGFISLVCFSFFYTSSITTVINQNDDLMKQIKYISAQYKIEPIDAKIDGNTIIPGITGSEIDIKKSYKNMKKLNEFNDSLLIYKKIKPNVTIDNVYDKYIISGNTNKKEVALVFLVSENDDVSKIVKILNEDKATFFIDGNWFENNNQKIMDLIENDFTIGNLGYNFNYKVNGIAWMNTIVTKIGNQKNSYCYNEIENLEDLEICKVNNSYTIRPNIIVKNNPLNTIKQQLKNGSIISLEINDVVIKELQLIIDYINSKDLELVNLEQLLEE